jgi:hypothetical protein
MYDPVRDPSARRRRMTIEDEDLDEYTRRRPFNHPPAERNMRNNYIDIINAVANHSAQLAMTRPYAH